jgi:UPF0755 protein
MRLLKIPLFILFFVLVLFLVTGGLAVVVAVLNSPTGAVPAEGALFEVRKGEASEYVFLRLEEGNFVHSSLLLRVIAKLAGTESSLKTGVYRIRPGYSTVDIHNLLVSGKQEMKRVTVKEGWTIRQTAREFEAAGLLSAADFLKAAASPATAKKYGIAGRSVEGFLFPETYYFPYEVSAEDVIAMMVGTFFKRLTDLYPAYSNLDKKTLFEKVILASIIEREYRREDEAPVIASVFYNRLAVGQKLESCATVAYVLTEIKGRPHPERLTWADVAVDSPYNTYEHFGLPPGPIGSPGATSLSAAFLPLKTRYRYFVLKDQATGQHEFSETFRKHLNAKEMYLKSY